VTTLRAAHAEFLPEIDMCACELCNEVSYARNAFDLYGARRLTAAGERYYAAVSARLRALVEGRHRRRTIAEWAVQERAAFVAEHGREPRPQEGVVKVRMSDFYVTGMGLGIGPRPWFDAPSQPG
jgi:hypothetical protein